MPSEHAPSLWFDADGAAGIRHRLAAGHVLTRRIVQAARRAADAGEQRLAVGAWAALALAEGDAASARRLADLLLAEEAYPQDLGLAHRGLQLAVAHECCAGLWDEPRLQAIRAAAGGLVDRLRHATSSHNPHSVQNNWWGVTHGGILLAAMISRREEETRWALGRCLAFTQHFGPAGLYHEGLGYQMYTLSHLLPALAAADRCGLVDLPGEFPWIRRLAESLYSFTSLRPAVSDSTTPTEGFGMMLSWNDAGLTWSSSNVSPLMLAYADPDRRAALADWSLRLEAGEAAQLYAGWEGWPFALALPPDLWSDGTTARPLRTHVCDHRQGLAVFRDRWQDGDDALLGCYARATHIGGHSHDDAGSVRLMALGQDWIIGGGQARGDAAWQSVMTPDEAGPRKPGCGSVLWDETRDSGGIFAVDLRRASHAYHERYAALAGNSSLGVPAAVALLDLVDDHLGRPWTWRITHAPGQRMEPDGDGAGFRLLAQDGTQASFRFIGQIPSAIRCESTGDSQRTYSNGLSVAYPGRPVVAAAFPARKHLVVQVAIVVTRGAGPAISRGEGLDIAIGDRVWRRPLGAAAPADYDPLLGGTLARWADGRRGS
jgi:hypothetical protein